MSGDSNARFLTAKAYRQKRLMDGARLVPLLGAVLMGFPLVRLFLQPGSPETLGATIIYMFAIWLGLILATFILSRRLRDSGPPD